MLQFEAQRITRNITRIHGFCTEQMYLIEGSEKALLIDSGRGFGDLRGFIESLTAKPVTVLLSHGHVDHAMGAGQFETVYMNRSDDFIYKRHSRRYFRLNNIEYYPEVCRSITDDDMIPAADCEGFLPLRCGDYFDIGGETVMAISCPGHTPGSMIFLIRNARILILGDSCAPQTFVFDDYSTGINTYLEGLENAESKTRGLYDRSLFSHVSGEGGTDMLTANIENCRRVLSGTDEDFPFFWKSRKFRASRTPRYENGRVDSRFANLIYSDDTKNR